MTHSFFSQQHRIADRIGQQRVRTFLACLLTLIGALATAGKVSALPQFAGVATQTYAFKTGGTLAKAAQSCALCHVGPPKLNPYGQTVKGALAAANTKNLTGAILHSVDSQDSDGDGATNGAELAADTLPGDAASKPAAGTTPTVMAAPVTSGAGESSEPNYWSLAELLYPKHAQHPIVVHFPVALLFASLLFDLLGYWKRNETLMQVGFCNLIVAALGSLASIVTGLLAWKFAYGGTSFTDPANRNLFLHLILAIVTTLLLLLLWGVRVRQRGKLGHRVSRMYVVFGIFAAAAMSITGHLGGILSGVVH